MQELINNLTSKVNLSEEQAQSAIEQVREFLKTKLPEQFHTHLDGALNGQNIDPSAIMGQAKGILGGLFGGKK